MAVLRRVAFDTSSLGNLAGNEVAPSVFADALDRRSCRIAVVKISIAQSVRGQTEYVRRRVLALGRLGFDRCPGLVDSRFVLRDERAGKPIGGPRFCNFPLLPALFASAHDEREFARELSGHSELLGKVIQPRTARDHGAEAILDWWRALPEKERRELKAHLGAPAISHELIGPRGSVTRRMLEHDAHAGYAAESLGDVPNHRTSLAYAGLLSLYLIARLMHEEHTPTFPWLKAEGDDRNDLDIVAEAAYCDVFVTDDGNLRERLRFLQEKGCIAFDVLTTTEFLQADA